MHAGNDTGKRIPGLADYLSGRLARTQARLTESYPDAAAKLREAVARLRCSLASSPDAIEAHATLSETLGGLALLEYAEILRLPRLKADALELERLLHGRPGA